MTNLKEIKLSNENKIYFPSGITKGDLINYYKKISKYILVHLKDRPLVMERFPDGINGKRFYQKNIPNYFPKWIKRIKIKHSEKSTTYVVCDSPETLIYLANLGCIHFHIWLSQIDNLRYPDKLIFDLDPQDENSLEIIKNTALAFKFVLEKINLKPFIMSTGSRGLHIVVHLNKDTEFKEVRDFAVEIASFIAEKDSNLTLEQRIAKRKGRVFIDTYRNSFSQTGIAPYSVRAIDNAPIAVPISWNELKNFSPEKYTIKNLPKNLDSWKDFFKKCYSIKKAKETFYRIKI